MNTDNIVISLFDPLLDHIASDSEKARTRKPRSPILLLSATASPLATQYVIFVSREHENGARKLEPALRDSIEKSILRTMRKGSGRKKTIDGIAIRIVPVDYADIWSLSKCNTLFENVLPSEFKNVHAPKTITVNLLSSTTAARTALYLNCLKLLRENWRSTTMVVVTNASTEKGKIRLRHDSVSSERPVPVGLLAQGVGTKARTYAEALDRLEPVITMMRNENILITGPTGAGKSELAKLIIAYMKALDRDATDENCINQNVAAIAPSLIESELFGHEKNAFTGAGDRHIGIFERANRGVVFLDEIGVLPRHLQAKLLTVLDRSPFTRVGGSEPVVSNFLLICGTNVDLQSACEKGTFRRDLYERLRTWTVEVPPLRDRPDDLEIALQRELVSWKRKTGTQIDFTGREARTVYMDLAKAYPWTGNYREFHATFIHLAIAAKNGRIAKIDVENEFKRMKLSQRVFGRVSSAESNVSDEMPGSEYDLTELAQLACALDVCRKAKTASEAGEILFAARAETAKRNGTQFNGASSLQRLFSQFGLKASFKHGSCSLRSQ